MRFSAEDIEHGVLRQNRPNPVLPMRPFTTTDPRRHCISDHFDARIHFALVCGARSCPAIAYYDAARLDAQLDQAAGSFINGSAVHWDPDHKTLWLSKIFDWYAQDFGGQEAVVGLIQKHSRNKDIRNLPSFAELKVRYHAYDWGINQLGAE
jgi:hypothetical protein